MSNLIMLAKNGSMGQVAYSKCIVLHFTIESTGNKVHYTKDPCVIALLGFFMFGKEGCNKTCFFSG